MTWFLIVLALLITIIISAYVIVRKKTSVKKRLIQIRDSTLAATPVLQEKEKASWLSFDNFKKSRLASTEQIQQLMATLSNELSAAGLGDDPFRLLLVWVIIVIVLPLIASQLGTDMIMVIALVVVTAAGPLLFIRYKKAKRRTKFEHQLPVAIDIIRNALKAGYTFPFSMNTVASELDDPISEEFMMTYRETQLGLPLSEALEHMAKRTSSGDIELLNIAVSVQTNVGGNLIEILENIAQTLSAKHDLEEDIKVKTASGKITGIMLAVLPVALLLALNIINPEYVTIFFKDTLGKFMLGFCVIWEIIGYLFIRKIMNIKF